MLKNLFKESLAAGLCIFSLACQNSKPQAEVAQVSMSDASGLLGGYIDLVNSVPPAQSSDPTHPITVKAGEKVLVDGWLMFGDPAGGVTMDEVYGVVNSKQIKAEPIQRLDVSSQFHNPKLAHAGFHLDIDPKLFPDGVTRIDIMGRTKDGKVYHLPQPLYLLPR
jgi:hypothetical protein